MLEINRFKHLSITTWAYTNYKTTQNVHLKCMQMQTSKHYSFDLGHYAKLQTNKSIDVQMQTFQVRNHATRNKKARYKKYGSQDGQS